MQKTIDEVVDTLNSIGFNEDNYSIFVKIGDNQYPAKLMYKELFDAELHEFNSHVAMRELKGIGLEVIDVRKSNTSIWKVSHSPKYFNKETIYWLEKNQYLCVHQDTGNGGGDNFISQIKLGDIVSLGYGNSIARLVRVCSDIVVDESSPLDKKWNLRKYVQIKHLPKPVDYNGPDKGWSPRRQNTCYLVPVNELNQFESVILKPYYELELKELNSELDSVNNVRENTMLPTSSPLNQILYGPPGTGKTYATINKALQIVDSEFHQIHRNDRIKLKARFDELLDNNRVGFVTFHQSFSYEDFVEGLKAESENGILS